MGLNRSQQMARIRSKNTSPEVVLRQALWAKGLRYRLRYKTPGGRPDLVFLGSRIAVFVDGCFWHGCPEHYVRPRTREDFWADKLRDNVERDRRQTALLEEKGWVVIRVWEHQVFTDLESITQMIGRVCRQDRRPPVLTNELRVLEAEPVDRDGTWEQRVLIELRSGSRSSIRHRRHTRKW